MVGVAVSTGAKEGCIVSGSVVGGIVVIGATVGGIVVIGASVGGPDIGAPREQYFRFSNALYVGDPHAAYWSGVN
jgi:hypothetical protein